MRNYTSFTGNVPIANFGKLFQAIPHNHIWLLEITVEHTAG